MRNGALGRAPMWLQMSFGRLTNRIKLDTTYILLIAPLRFGEVTLHLVQHLLKNCVDVYIIVLSNFILPPVSKLLTMLSTRRSRSQPRSKFWLRYKVFRNSPELVLLDFTTLRLGHT